MKQDRHDQYVNAVKALEESLKDVQIDTFDLSPEEEEALQAAPERIWELHEAFLARYTPYREEYDMRDRAFRKYLAVVLLKGEPVFRKAFDEGYSAGEDT